MISQRKAEEKEKRNRKDDRREEERYSKPAVDTRANVLQFPKAYPKHKTEPQLTVYRITVAKRSIEDVLTCLEGIKLPGTTITAGIGTWYNDHGELLTEQNVTVEASDFTLDKVFQLAVKLLNFRGYDESVKPEDSAYLTTDGKDPILITKEGLFKHIKKGEK